jgi:hypothetical protein
LKFSLGPHYERNSRASSEHSRTRSAIVGRLRDGMSVLLRFVLSKQSRLLACSLARPIQVGRAMRQKRETSTPRTKPFRSSQGHQISRGHSSKLPVKKSENGATKSPSIGELGEVENVGAPFPNSKTKSRIEFKPVSKRSFHPGLQSSEI